MSAEIAEALRRIASQEARLQFAAFDPDVAWRLALALREAGQAENAPIVATVETWGMPLAAFALPGATADNFDWARRKVNVVRRFERASYAIGLEQSAKGRTLADLGALPERDYALHGGAFPIRVRSAGCIGAVAVSGLPQREDHEMVVKALERTLADEAARGVEATVG